MNGATAITDESVVRPSSGVAWVEVDGEVILLDDATGRLHLLDPIGSLVFQCLDDIGSVAEIASEFSEELGVPYDVVLADIVTLLRRLGEAGLVTARLNVGAQTPTSFSV